MPYELWEVVHLAGVIALFASLGCLAALSLVARPEVVEVVQGAARRRAGADLPRGVRPPREARLRKPGELGRVGVYQARRWLVLGGALAFVRKAGRNATAVLLLCALLGAVAAWAAVTKPGM